MADEQISSGDFVCEYKYSCSYETKEKSLYDEDYEENGEGCYTVEVVAGGRKICLDATVNLNSWGRYLNHGRRSEENIKMFKPLLIRGKWRVGFLALRDIKQGEELCWDYGRQSHPPEWMRVRKVN